MEFKILGFVFSVKKIKKPDIIELDIEDTLKVMEDDYKKSQLLNY